MSKVLFLSLWFLPQVGGMEMSSYEIVNSILESGNDVVVATADHSAAKEFDSKQNFSIYRVAGVFLSKLATNNVVKRGWYYILYYYKYYKVVNSIIRFYKPDTIIVADEQTRNWYGFFVRFIKRKPVVIASMPEKASQRFKVRIVRKTLDVASDILCVSRSTLDKMCETFGEEYRSKMTVLYRTISNDLLCKPIDTDKVNTIRTKYNLNGKILILSVCRLNKKKGLDTLIKALSIDENRKRLMIMIIGEGPDYNRLSDMVDRFELNDKVLFIGKVSREEIVNYYDACDFFVLPSEEESFGRVFVEAGARHKTSIGCNVGGVPEIIQHNKTGLLVAPHNPMELAKCVDLLIDNPSKRTEMENEIYCEVKEKFSPLILTRFWKTYLKSNNVEEA